MNNWGMLQGSAWHKFSSQKLGLKTQTGILCWRNSAAKYYKKFKKTKTKLV